MPSAITETAVFANINGCEVSIYFDEEALKFVARNVPCSVCGKVTNIKTKNTDEIVVVHKSVDLPILEIQSNGIKLDRNHPIFREVRRRIRSCKAIGKAFCGECNIEHGIKAEFEVSIGLPSLSNALEQEV